MRDGCVSRLGVPPLPYTYPASPHISPRLAQGWLFEKKAAEPFWSVWSKHALGRVHWLRTFPGLADTVGTCTILTISLVLRVTAVDEYVLLRGDRVGQCSVGQCRVGQCRVGQ